MAANLSPGAAIVRKLVWGEFTEDLELFDVIIASDVLFQSQTWPPLAASVLPTASNRETGRN